jgi:hypothetical protein
VRGTADVNFFRHSVLFLPDPSGASGRPRQRTIAS